MKRALKALQLAKKQLNRLSNPKIYRVRPNIRFEQDEGYPHVRVAGVDEAGRGCLAGPVVAAAVVLPEDINLRVNRWIKQVRDSKLLRVEQREELEPLIKQWSLAYSVGVATVEEIDHHNIHGASHLAMTRAVNGLAHIPVRILIDGKFVPKDLRAVAKPIIKGDLKCLSIACASILAKTHRDREMRRLHEVFPAYGFSSHKGYPTEEHLTALRTHGVTNIHRRSFAPVAELLF